jgi:hypothetical protein
MFKPSKTAASAALSSLALLAATVAQAAGGDLGQAEKQSTNWTAIIMFAAFVVSVVADVASPLTCDAAIATGSDPAEP